MKGGDGVLKPSTAPNKPFIDSNYKYLQRVNVRSSYKLRFFNKKKKDHKKKKKIKKK